MNVKEIRARARSLKVTHYSRMKKHDLIRAVQLAEGNTDCFQQIEGCGEIDCCWRDDCQVGE